MNKKILVAVVALVVLGGGYWYLRGGSNGAEERFIVDTIATDTTLTQNTVVAGDHKMVLEGGAALTVEGDFKVDGVLTCDRGPVTVVVTGALEVNRRIECMRPDENADGLGITLVAGGPVTFSKDAVVASNGHVQVVSEADLAKHTQSELDALFVEAGANTGAGTRIGPFVEGALQQVSYNASPVEISRSVLVPEARAQEARDKDGNALPQVVVKGTWVIGSGGAAPSGVDVPTPPKEVKKILLNFDFGGNNNIEIRDFHLVGPNGRDGEDDIGKSCNARGGKGEDAFRMRVNAANVTIDNFRLELGNGGKGGDAETITDCDPGRATGGAGGAAGNFKMTALGKIVINNFHIVPGRGGQGGAATAVGKQGVDGCPGTKGGDAIAIGGDGGKNKKELAALGAVEGIGSVTIDKVEGGEGGLAIAKPGKGGNGNGCKCGGGKGGNANATGGKGGDASLKLMGSAGEATGGDGGDANARGGEGGSGGHCPLKPAGGKGGNGGNAISKIGEAGKGTSGNGADGIVQDETGGNGGNGGNGCGPGGGGKGGLGKPNGTDGKPGELQCPEDTRTTPPPVTDPGKTPPPPTTEGTGAAKKKVKVIQYNGKYLPVDQLIVENEEGCGADHWHASRGVVMATDGTPVPDPGPQCGYGKTREKPAMDIEI